MAAFRSQGASSSISRFSYHVFLSFRGKDTRKNFTDHLYTALLNAGIRTFRDDDELHRGETIGTQLINEIEQSRILMVVLSKDYASSQWCLTELVKFLECKNRYGRVVLPIFYHVDRAQVREQTGSYEESFEKHRMSYTRKSEEKKKAWMEKVNQWRAALVEVADMDGTMFQNQPQGPESEFIREIVKETGRILNRPIFRVSTYPVGIESRVERLNLWLQDGSDAVGLFVLYGIGGIGKTTIAKTVYNLNYDKFDGSSFLANIREASTQPYGLACLQQQLLSDITKKEIRKIYNVDEGIIKIKDVVCHKRVLLVLDDVDDLDQLDTVFGMREWFCSGSKVIITTRHERLLKGHDICEMYKVKPLDEKESLLLFCWHAFRQDHPHESYANLSRSVANHCGGLPLALQVLGSSLSGKNQDVWENTLKKLRAIQDSQILEKLMISYDNLSDYHDQNLFLDITCFFIGKDKGYVVSILDQDFFPIAGIQNLVDRCLLTISGTNKLMMHQLLRDMGREVIRQESPERPGKRSRLWRLKDSFNVLKENSGTDAVAGFVLDMQKVKEVKLSAEKPPVSEDNSNKLVVANQRYSVKRRPIWFFGQVMTDSHESSTDISFPTDALARMNNLRLLQLSYVHLTGCYEIFPKGLRWIFWRGFPSEVIPNDLSMDNLIVLDMRNSKLEQVWRGSKFLPLLKILNLSHSHGLRRTPDFSGLPNLEKLILEYCLGLFELHESIGDLEKLVFLNLRGCKNLRKLPSEIGTLKSLKTLIIIGCSRLKLPVELGKLESLTELLANGIALNEFLYTCDEPKAWPNIFISWISKRRMPQQPIRFSFASLSRSLRILSLAYCNLEVISVDLSSFSSLSSLNLSGNPICSLPMNINSLPMLQRLLLYSCTRLQSLPELQSSVTDLRVEGCTSLETLKNLPNLLKSLFFDVRGCEKLAVVQELFVLQPIGNFDLEMIRSLGILDLESIRNSRVELFNKMTETRRTVPVQGLYEFDIFSTYIPSREVPSHFSVMGTDSSVSLIVPTRPNTTLLGLNICFVYTRRRRKLDDWYAFYLKVENRTKGMKLVYGPTFISIPGVMEDITFLGHWKLGNKLNPGDEVNVSVMGWSYNYRIKGFGVSLVYDEGAKEGGEICLYNALSYQVRSNEYFLSHPEYFMHRGVSLDEWTKMGLYQSMFGDCVQNTESTSEEEEEEEEEEEDDEFDYDCAEIDEEVVAEVEDLVTARNWRNHQIT